MIGLTINSKRLCPVCTGRLPDERFERSQPYCDVWACPHCGQWVTIRPWGPASLSLLSALLALGPMILFVFIGQYTREVWQLMVYFGVTYTVVVTTVCWLFKWFGYEVHRAPTLFRCLTCDYDMTGSLMAGRDVCPECGSTVNTCTLELKRRTQHVTLR